METDVARAGEKVRISFDAEPGLRRAVRLAAARRDITVREYLTRIVSEGLAGSVGEKGERHG